MKLEDLPKYYSPKSPGLTDASASTSKDALSITDVMAAQGMTQNRAEMGFSAFLGKMGISMKTLTDKSTRNLAEMLTQGSGLGVVDCVKSCKDYPNAAPGAKRLAQRLQDFEEDNRIQLERFL